MSFGRTAIFKAFTPIDASGHVVATVLSEDRPIDDDSGQIDPKPLKRAAPKRPKKGAQSVSSTSPKPTVDIDDPSGVVEPGESVDTSSDDFVRGDSSGSRRRF